MASNEMDFKRYLELVKRNKRLCIIVALVVMTVATVASYLIPDKFEAKSTVFIEKSVIAELIKGLAFTPSVEDKIRALSYTMSSKPLLAKVIDDLGLKNDNDAAQEKLIKNLKDNTHIKILDQDGMFTISFQSNNPKLARDYVNSLVRHYIEDNASSKREDSIGATEFLSEQMETFKHKLQKSEEVSNAYRRGEGAVASMDPASVMQNINESQQRLEELKIKQAQLQSSIASLTKSNSSQANLSALQKRLQELQLQYTDSYPEILRLKEQIRVQEEQKNISRPIDSPEYDRLVSDLNATRQAESYLRANIEKGHSLLRSIPAAKATLENLEREKSTQKALFETMLAREGQSEFSKQLSVHDRSTIFRIIDKAVLPNKPVSPDRKKIILFGIIAGICLGVGLVILKDNLDDSVKNVDMVKRFGLPVLAVIPRIEDPQQIAAQARQDLKLYIAAGMYFSLILAVLVLEALGNPAVARVMNKISSLNS